VLRKLLRSVGMRIVGGHDQVVVAEVELAALSGVTVSPDDPSSVYPAMRKLHERGRLAIITTLGPRGALLSGPAGRYEAKGHEVNAVDTTGAGDCFIGGFAAALSKSASVPDVINFANKAAAISVTRRGAASAFPLVAEVKFNYPAAS
jgi:ribokinase